MVKSIFPLSFVGRPSAVRGSDVLCARLRRRLFLRNSLLGLMRHAVFVLNCCASASLGSRGVASSRRPALKQSSLHDRALARLLRLCRLAGPPPRQSSKEALCELLKVNSLEEELHPSSVVPFEWSKLKLLGSEWQVKPQDITNVAPEHISKWFVRPGLFRLSVEAADAVGAAAEPITPYWDPILANSKKKRQLFFSALRDRGLLCYRRRVHAFVGIFFVAKKNHQIRMVLDGRATNISHMLPPHSALGTVAAWCDADFSEAAPGRLWKASGDLQDSFYQFTSWALAEDFAFDYPVRAGDVGVSSIFENGQYVSISPDEIIYNCFCGIPMGWSWALWAIHGLVSHVLRTASDSFSGPLVEDRRTASFLRPGCPLAGAYVDNFLIVATNKADALFLYLAVVDRFAKLGIKLHELRPPCDDWDFEYLGVVFSEGGRVVRPKRSRAWRLYRSLQYLGTLPQVHGKMLRVVLGHIVNFFQFMPLVLSNLSASYAFVESFLTGWGELWPQVRTELDLVAGYVFLAEADLGAAWAPWGFCSDSSEAGFAVHARHFSACELKSIGNVKERWRFTAVEKLPDFALECPALSSEKEVPVGVSVACRLFGQQLGEAEARREAPCVRAVPRNVDWVATGLVESLPDDCLQQSHWTLLLRGGWRYAAPMHLKEGRASLLGLEFAALEDDCFEKRVLGFGDNLSEICATEKGRAADPALRVLLKRALGTTVACGIRWRRRYVESERNPSDADSRRHSLPGERYHGSKLRDVQCLGFNDAEGPPGGPPARQRPRHLARHPWWKKASRAELLSRPGKMGPRSVTSSRMPREQLSCKDALALHPARHPWWNKASREDLLARSGKSGPRFAASPGAPAVRSYKDVLVQPRPPPGLLRWRVAKDGSQQSVVAPLPSVAKDAPPGLLTRRRAKSGCLRSVQFHYAATCPASLRDQLCPDPPSAGTRATVCPDSYSYPGRAREDLLGSEPCVHGGVALDRVRIGEPRTTWAGPAVGSVQIAFESGSGVPRRIQASDGTDVHGGVAPGRVRTGELRTTWKGLAVGSVQVASELGSGEPRKHNRGQAKRSPEVLLRLEAARSRRLQPSGTCSLRRGKAMLELFSGCGRLSGAALDLGLRVGVPFDIEDSRSLDLQNRKVQSLVRKWIRDGKLWYVHFGTPCTGFSCANTAGSGRSWEHSLACARFTVQCIKLCQRCGVFWTVENPASSALFRWEPFARVCLDTNATAITYDNCRFGTPWLKPTCLVGSLPGLHSLALRCHGCPRHLHLCGKVEDWTGRQRWLTSLAGAYPPALCRLWAKVAGASAPSCAWRRADDTRMSSEWEADLQKQLGASWHAVNRVPACPLRFKLPFNAAGKSWGADLSPLKA